TSAGLDNRSSTISSLRHKFRDVTQKIRQLLRVEISCVEIQASFSGIICRGLTPFLFSFLFLGAGGHAGYAAPTWL
ncbi:MAG TPA: hypothetical protein VM425_14045, partial [Myxococcota bacterium]|nr:hypothetical protein [Myxococcota bacterium]